MVAPGGSREVPRARRKTENVCYPHLTTLEVGQVLLKLKASNPGAATKEIAALVGLSERHCQRLMKRARETAKQSEN